MSATGNLLDAQDDKMFKLMKQLELYRRTINNIDDYFEYRNESKSDRQFIHEQLDGLTKKLTLVK